MDDYPPLSHPTTNLRKYVSEAWLPRLPNIILKHDRKRLKGGAATTTATRLLKCGVKPREGKRMLVGVDAIDVDELAEACNRWYYKSVPKNVDLKTIAREDYALFYDAAEATRDGAINDIRPDHRFVSFTMPAIGFYSIKAEVFDDDDDDDPTPSPTSPNGWPPLDLPEPPNTAVSEVWSVSTATHTTRLSKTLRQTLLETAASALHLSEPSRTKGWEWLTPDEAWSIAKEQRGQRCGGFGPRVEDEAESTLRKLSSDALGGWECWLWGKNSTASWPERSFLSALGTLVVVQPNWVAPVGTLDYFSDPQDFSDGLRGESSFFSSDALWAALHDTCRYLGIHHFVVTTYAETVVGCFSLNHQIGHIAAPLEGIRGEPSTLIHLMYWMRSGMRDCEDGWLPPLEEEVPERFMKRGSGNFPGVDEAIENVLRPILADPDVKAMLARDSYEDRAPKTSFLSARAAQVAQRIDLERRAEYLEVGLEGLFFGKEAAAWSSRALPPKAQGWVPPTAEAEAQLTKKRKAFRDEGVAEDHFPSSSSKRARKASSTKRNRPKMKGKAREDLPPLAEHAPTHAVHHRRSVSADDAHVNVQGEGSGEATSHRTFVGTGRQKRIASGTTQDRSATYAESGRDESACTGPVVPSRCRSRSVDAARGRKTQGRDPPRALRRSTRVITPPERLVL